MSARVVWSDGGGEGTLVSVAADLIVVRSAVPWPPGSRVEAKAYGADGEVTFRLKVHSSKRDDAGQFLVTGRQLDLSREARSRLEAMAVAVR